MLRIFEHFGKRRVGMKEHKARKSRGYWSYGQETPGSAKRAEETREYNAEIAGEALQAVQTIVSALASPEGGRFSVVFSEDVPTATTGLVTRRVRVTPKPLFDPSLKMIEACTVLTGLATHEVGHTWVSPLTEAVLNDYFPGSKTAEQVAFVLDDTRIDAFLRRRFPGVAFAIRPTLAYVAKQTGEQPPLQYTPQLSVASQIAFMVNAVRYASHTRWIGDPLTREMRARWQAWAQANANIETKDEVIAALRAGIALIHEPEPEPEQQPGDGEGEEQPEPEHEVEEAEPDDFGDGERAPEDDEPEDSDEQDDDWDDEDEEGDGSDSDDDEPSEDESDGPSEGSDPSEDEPEDDEGNSDEGDESEDGDEGDESDDPTDGEGNGEEPTDQDGEAEDDGDVEDDGSEAESESEGFDNDGDEGEDTESESEPDGGEISGPIGNDQDGGGDSVDLSDIPEPLPEEEIVAPDQDAYNEDTSAEAQDLQERIEQQKTIERVAASDGFGTIKVNVV